jgi:hypothetical protein
MYYRSYTSYYIKDLKGQRTSFTSTYHYERLLTPDPEASSHHQGVRPHAKQPFHRDEPELVVSHKSSQSRNRIKLRFQEEY